MCHGISEISLCAPGDEEGWKPLLWTSVGHQDLVLRPLLSSASIHFLGQGLSNVGCNPSVAREVSVEDQDKYFSWDNKSISLKVAAHSISGKDRPCTMELLMLCVRVCLPQCSTTRISFHRLWPKELEKHCLGWCHPVPRFYCHPYTHESRGRIYTGNGTWLPNCRLPYPVTYGISQLECISCVAKYYDQNLKTCYPSLQCLRIRQFCLSASLTSLSLSYPTFSAPSNSVSSNLYVYPEPYHFSPPPWPPP